MEAAAAQRALQLQLLRLKCFRADRALFLGLVGAAVGARPALPRLDLLASPEAMTVECLWAEIAVG